jgi:hypothetical protein
VAVGLATLQDATNASYAALYTVSADKTAKIFKRSDAALVQSYVLPEIPTTAMMVSQSLYVATKNPPVLWVYDNKAGALAKMLEIGPKTGKLQNCSWTRTPSIFWREGVQVSARIR